MVMASEERIDVWVPGRLCLLGEHSDWAGQLHRTNPDIHTEGKAIIVGTSQGLHATVQRQERRVIQMTSTTHEGTRRDTAMDLDEPGLVQIAQQGGYWSYVAGVAYWMLVELQIGGIVINNDRTTLPMGKGLSSSAAVCVLVAKAFNEAYGLKLTTRGLMEYAYRGERLTPSQCGRMDQACAFGSTPVCLTFDGDIMHVQPVELACDLYIVLVDVLGAKDTTRILHDLQAAYENDAMTQKHMAVQKLFGVTNKETCSGAIAAMQAGDATALGVLMSEAQGAFDQFAAPMSLELVSPKLHQVMAMPELQQYLFGAKGVGSQGDGCAQLLAKSKESMAHVVSILEALKYPCIPMIVQSCQ